MASEQREEQHSKSHGMPTQRLRRPSSSPSSPPNARVVERRKRPIRKESRASHHFQKTPIGIAAGIAGFLLFLWRWTDRHESTMARWNATKGRINGSNLRLPRTRRTNTTHPTDSSRHANEEEVSSVPLPPASEDDTANRSKQADHLKHWSLPFIHIVNTRFMQNQGTLSTLAQARLLLFQTFCLSTMTNQRSQHFLWIIKTDPSLDLNVRTSMVELLQDYEHFFLVGSNTNYLIGHESGAFRGGVEGAELLRLAEQGLIYTGNVDLLRAAQQVQESRVVLETRLDADDGLTSGYLAYVEMEAIGRFLGLGPLALPEVKTEEHEGSEMEVTNVVKEDEREGDPDSNENNAITLPAPKSEQRRDNIRPNWLYWCSRQHAEWFADPSPAMVNNDLGQVNAVRHSKMCVTPGITVGFNVGTTYESVPQHEHVKLYRNIEQLGGCGLANNVDCIGLVQRFPMMAVRSRTPTSAGMMGVEFQEAEAIPNFMREKLWKLLLSPHFNIQLEDVQRTQKFIREYIFEIAMDNLEGQCTFGHSCKVSSKELLQKMMEAANGKKEVESPRFELPGPTTDLEMPTDIERIVNDDESATRSRTTISKGTTADHERNSAGE